MQLRPEIPGWLRTKTIQAQRSFMVIPLGLMQITLGRHVISGLDENMNKNKGAIQPGSPPCFVVNQSGNQFRISAFSMTTGSTGTSPCMPVDPVFTASIASTTACPSTTLPNTA